MERWTYFDTNVYNRLADSLSPSQVARLPDALDELQLRVAISPINIIEILHLGEVDRKEQLIWTAQHIAKPPMLAEVEAIIVDYAARTLGDPRLEHLCLDHVVARRPLRDEWEAVYREKERTLRIDPAATQWVQMIKHTYAYCHALISRGRKLGSDPHLPDLRGDNVAREQAAELLKRATQAVRAHPPVAAHDDRYLQHVALLTATILCVGYTPFPEPIDEFWQALGIDHFDERYDFVSTRMPAVQQDGPLIALFDITTWQSQRKYSAGNWLDGYHVQYLQFVPEMLTLDAGLLEYGRSCPPRSRVRTNLRSGEPLITQLVEAVS